MSATVSARRFHLSGSVLAAFALTLSLHGAWWYFLARPWSPAVPPLAMAESPRMTYLPGSDREASALGSPVLFALPSERGFSGGLRAAAVPQTLRAAASEPVLLARSTPVASAGHYLHSLDQIVAETAPPDTFVPSAARLFSIPAGRTGFVLRVYWPDGAPAVRGGLPGAGVLAPVLQDRPWELGAVLEFDAQGGVQHVFIDKPTTSRERNEMLARTLRAVRIDSGGQAMRTRVVVQYDQEAGPRAPAGGAGRP